MAPTAAYDEIADWYEHEFLGAAPRPASDAIRSASAAPCATCSATGERRLPGDRLRHRRARGAGPRAGLDPVGVDLSAGMLRHARGRLPVAPADAERLPVRDALLPAVIAVMVHTDMPGYPAVLREAAAGPAAGRGVRARRRPPVLLRRVRRPQRPGRRRDPPRLPRRPLDEGVVDGPGRPRQGRRGSPAPAQPHARLPERRPDPERLAEGGDHPRHAGYLCTQASMNPCGVPECVLNARRGRCRTGP